MRLRNVSQFIFLALLGAVAHGQTVVQAGSGSYASTIQSDRLNDDGFYAPTPATMLSEYNTLFLASWLQGKPMPTNHWWTDLLIGQRESGSTWIQQQFDANGDAGQLWAYPQVVIPRNSGMSLFYPKSFIPNTSGSPATAQGTMDLGPLLRVDHYTGLRLAATDNMLGDFTGAAYPGGWTATGDLAGTTPVAGGTWPGESPAVSGLIGNACVNTFRGTNATMGTLNSPSFVINNNYIDLKVGGGNDTTNDVVELVVGGNVVKTAVGQQDATLRWTQWNVSAYKGQSAQIVVKDTTSGSWGFILCNVVIGTNNASSPDTLFTELSVAAQAKVSAFSDWTVDYVETDSRGASAAMTVARGVPFVWGRYSGLSPRIHSGTGNALYGLNGSTIDTSSGSFTASAFSFDLYDSLGNPHAFGIFAPDNTHFTVNGDNVTASTPAYLVYGFLPDHTKLQEFSQYAYARVTAGQMTWVYNRAAKNVNGLGGSIDTTWALSVTPLKGSSTTTIQGFLPHHYRTTKNNIVPLSYTYQTPRGAMEMATGTLWRISWPFRGIAPVLPAPHVNGVANDYNASRMQTYLTNFANNHPTSGADSYFQGKEFGITAQYMTQAAQYGDPASFFTLESALKNQLTDWYTYTPGKAKNYFGYYPGWGSLIGFQDSFGTTGFNDHHFHYGYFAISTALLGMQDGAFLNQYGPMAMLLCKDYNNWDRTDTRFPYMRTFDVWEGHSNAGGVSAANGENQESSSEAMNAWVGMFMLGNMMGNNQMGDAGAMGYAMESSAVNEYWQDWKGTNFPTGYGKKTNGILQASGDVYATYFSGDPAWIYNIQWTPANHWNNYLARDKTFAQNQYNAMWAERQSLSDWDKTNNPGGFILNDSNTPAGLGAYPGDYTLGFEALFNPDQAAADLDNAWTNNQAVGTDVTYPGSVYYITHSLRGLGDPDQTTYTTMPTSQVYINGSGTRTYVLFNPDVVAHQANVFTNGVQIGTIVVAPHSLLTTQSFGSFNRLVPYYGISTPMPGTIQGPNFDYGGEGLAYHDTDTANTGGVYRPAEAVDIEQGTDGSFDVFNIQTSEWFKYSMNTTATGPYSVSFTVSAAAGSSFHLMDETGRNVSGVISVPNTGGAWTTITKTISFNAGAHVLRIFADAGGFKFKGMTFYATGAAASIPLGKTISFKSVSDGLFVTADNAGSLPLIANRTAAAGWEQFVVVDRGNGFVALQAVANGLYVTVNSAGQLIATASTAATGEAFQWIGVGVGRFALYSPSKNLLVSTPDSGHPLLANGPSFGDQTSFLLTVY